MLRKGHRPVGESVGAPRGWHECYHGVLATKGGSNSPDGRGLVALGSVGWAETGGALLCGDN